jgi:hypothetical protein
VVTEKDTQKLLNEIIGPAGKRYLNSDSKELFEVFGVDGEYGRHYSFLKAVSLLWNILIDRKVRGTFKIDLDQIFPQERLIQETGKSAFEHFRTDLWGAEGVDSTGRRIELGMVAGALVNDRDIINGLYTPDILFPQENPDPDEYIFYSRLPQDLSTEAEMMTRYGQGGLNGDTKCIERIHVTGGTNGILIKSLERFRPFTPSFIGRAEDQAYIMSAVTGDQDRLACLHRDGLFMRHDKESFAGEAIKSAGLGKIISDCIRILSFSSYARVLTKDLTPLKDLLDPFTGCFISKIPVTLVYLRFALRGAGFFEKGETGQGTRFIVEGSTRLNDAIKISLDDKAMKEQYDRERIGWNMYYNTLSAIERNLVEGEEFAMGLRQKALEIFEECRLKNQDD